MRTLIIVASTLFSLSAGASETCRISTGDGTAIGRGASKKEAKENARFECGIKRVDRHIAMRGNISQDVEDQYIDDCVNRECDKR